MKRTILLTLVAAIVVPFAESADTIPAMLPTAIDQLASWFDFNASDALLAAAPEGPLHDEIQLAMTDANLPN